MIKFRLFVAVSFHIDNGSFGKLFTLNVKTKGSFDVIISVNLNE